MAHRPIYFDSHSTTPVDPQVLEAMLPYFTEHFGNPASSGHQYGWAAEAGIKQAREILAGAIQASPEEIIFTSGATEANNLAIKGVAEAYFSEGRHLVTVQTEHSAVLDPCRYLESLGFEVTYLPVQGDGLLDLGELERAIRPDTVLVSVMAANNEIGVLQPLTEIGALCRDRRVLFHTDAAQAIGKIPLDVQAMNISLMSLTAHKLYGPKGIGVLYVRRRNPRVKLVPQLHGGGQERGLRSGTLYPPQIIGFARAVELALENREAETKRLGRLRDRLWQQLVEGLATPTTKTVVSARSNATRLTHNSTATSLLTAQPGLADLVPAPDSPLRLNGHPVRRLHHNLNFSVAGVDGQALLLGLQSQIAVSSGSACTSMRAEPSHVLQAIGRSEALARASLRFGLSRWTTEADIDRAAQVTCESIRALLSPNQ